MISFIQKHIMLLVLGVVGITSLFLFVSELTRNASARLIFIDVGQGDAILVTAPNRRQVLIDGGKYANISMKLRNYMPPSDRSINILIATHPDIDHVAGLSTILDEYSVDYFVHSGLLAGAPVYRTIANKVNSYGIQSFNAVAGQKIVLDTDMYLEILSPYEGQKIEEPNDYSVVIKVVYKDQSILLTGDASKITEQNLVALYGDRLESSILKLGHHGSKTSTDDIFVKTVDPEYGVISAGCNNTFGHPHASVLQTLDNNVIDLNTCDEGDIVFEFRNNSWQYFK